MIAKESFDALIEKVRAYLLRSGDESTDRKEVYTNFLLDCEQAGLNENQFYVEILKPASRGIDWEKTIEARENKNNPTQKKENAIDKDQAPSVNRDSEKKDEIQFPIRKKKMKIWIFIRRSL